MRSTLWNLCNWKMSYEKKNAVTLELEMLYLGIFGLQFRKTFLIFEVSALKFFLTQKFRARTKMPKFVENLPYLRNFGMEF